MIDSKLALKDFIKNLPDCKDTDPSLYVDLESNNLSREGTLSLVTVLVEPRRTIHLIDVTGLGNDAFTTAGSDGRTIKQILESPEVSKVFFDIRNDSDALFSLYGIRVQGIEDLQLMEIASRASWKKHVNGLAKCIERDAPIPLDEKQRWKRTKSEGTRLFDPALGGSYAVFDQRPLSADIQLYCVQDVIHMPSLRQLYIGKLCDAWRRKIEKETSERIRLSQGQDYVGRGPHKALGPPGWIYWKPSAKQQRSRDLVSRRRDSAAPSDVIGKQMTGGEGEGVTEILGKLRAISVSKPAPGMASKRRRQGGFSNDRDDDFGDYYGACDSNCGYCGGDHY